MDKLTKVCVYLLLGSVLAQNDLELYEAAKKGNPADVNQALASGANVNWKNQDHGRKWTALHVASYYNHPEIVSALIEAGADVDIVDDTKRSALHYAAFNNLLAVMKVLLKAGADSDLQDKDDSAPLHYAAAGNHPAALKVLLEAGANKDLREDSSGRTPLFLATEHKKKNAVKVLLNSGADPNIPRKDGKSSFQSYGGMTPLMAAAYHVDLTLVTTLIDAHANIRHLTDDGDTVLHYLARVPNISEEERTEQQKLARLLLRKGVDANKQNSHGNTAEDIAKVYDEIELTNILDNYTGPYDPTPADLALFAEAKVGNLADVNMALATGANPNWRNPEQEKGWTALHVASYYNHPAVVDALLAAGSNKDVWGDDGLTPIFLASWQGSIDALQILINYCADVNLPQNDGIFSGMTPLMVATNEGHLSIVKSLIASHANVRHHLGNGFTALHMAARTDQKDIALHLLQQGADISRQDNRGRNPSNIARNEGFEDLANILESYTGPYDTLVTAPPCQPKTAISTPTFDLYLLVCDVVVFIVAILYSVMY